PTRRGWRPPDAPPRTRGRASGSEPERGCRALPATARLEREKKQSQGPRTSCPRYSRRRPGSVSPGTDGERVCHLVVEPERRERHGPAQPRRPLGEPVSYPE